MKHVFFVHSQITKLISFSIIKNLSLTQEEVVILTYRGSDFYRDYRIYTFPFSSFPIESFPLQINFLSGRIKLRKLDAFINKVTDNDNYILYLPQVHERMLELMASHPKCLKYNLIEEGKLSFTQWRDRQIYTYSLKQFLFLKLNYGNRLSKQRAYLPETYFDAFKFTDAAFSDYDRVQKISLHANRTNSDYTDILVLEPLVEAGIVEINSYLEALHEMIKILISRGIDTISYKFHPEQQENKSKSDILNLFAKIERMSFIPIESNISLEEIAISSQANFYSTVSSMLYYAKYLGSHSYSFSNLIPHSSKFDSYFNLQPEIFKENLNYIEETSVKQN